MTTKSFEGPDRGNKMSNLRGLKGGKYGAASKGRSFREEWKRSGSDLSFEEWLQHQSEEASDDGHDA